MFFSLTYYLVLCGENWFRTDYTGSQKRKKEKKRERKEERKKKGKKNERKEERKEGRKKEKSKERRKGRKKERRKEKKQLVCIFAFFKNFLHPYDYYYDYDAINELKQPSWTATTLVV